MSLPILGLLVALVAVSGKGLNLLAPPAEVEYGFCDGSPEPFTFDVMSAEPFPILIQNGAMLSIAIQITLNEEVPVGTQVALNMVLEGIIPIKIPCLDIDGLTIGSCNYDGDELLTSGADFLCSTYVPEGQACSLPLRPGVYGSSNPLTVGPINSIPDILLPFLKGTIRAEGTMTDSVGKTIACAWIRVAVDH